jgi:hypothetical protein
MHFCDRVCCCYLGLFLNLYRPVKNLYKPKTMKFCIVNTAHPSHVNFEKAAQSALSVDITAARGWTVCPIQPHVPRILTNQIINCLRLLCSLCAQNNGMIEPLSYFALYKKLRSCSMRQRYTEFFAAVFEYRFVVRYLLKAVTYSYILMHCSVYMWYYWRFGR